MEHQVGCLKDGLERELLNMVAEPVDRFIADTEQAAHRIEVKHQNLKQIVAEAGESNHINTTAESHQTGGSITSPLDDSSMDVLNSGFLDAKSPCVEKPGPVNGTPDLDGNRKAHPADVRKDLSATDVSNPETTVTNPPASIGLCIEKSTEGEISTEVKETIEEIREKVVASSTIKMPEEKTDGNINGKFNQEINRTQPEIQSRESMFDSPFPRKRAPVNMPVKGLIPKSCAEANCPSITKVNNKEPEVCEDSKYVACQQSQDTSTNKSIREGSPIASSTQNEQRVTALLQESSMDEIVLTPLPKEPTNLFKAAIDEFSVRGGIHAAIPDLNADELVRAIQNFDDLQNKAFDEECGTSARPPPCEIDVYEDKQKSEGKETALHEETGAVVLQQSA